MYKPWKGHLEGGITLLRGLTITMAIDHVLTGMILQVPIRFKSLEFFLSSESTTPSFGASSNDDFFAICLYMLNFWGVRR